MYRGNLLKLITQHDSPISYFLNLSGDTIRLNDLIGKSVRIKYTGVINCISCGKRTKTSFAQGYCYNCFQTSPETEECILRPELCKAHLGEGRDPEWSREHHLKPHIVYLAYSSNVKVGVTRETQAPTRWIDQGANMALPLLKTPNRHIAGIAEVYLKQKFSDKTNWRKMLSPPELMMPNLEDEAAVALDYLPKELKKYAIKSQQYNFQYPVDWFPAKLKAVNLEKTPELKSVLVGIKGQYLLFESGEAINIRKHNGFEVDLDF